ncbi:hypothetical protein FLGSB24_07130 [Flavobacterium sp. GSB-24]|nr:hypothetical protein FLGSB24_07130 [Flavobacterium sp. GSB-24]
MRKLLYSFLFLISFISYAQCPFGSTQFGTTQSIIYNREAVAGTNVGTVTFTNVPMGRYVAVNVIQGLTYTITASSNQSFIKRITFFNQTNTAVNVGSALAGSNNGNATSTNWLAGFTGTLFIKINNNSNCISTTGNNSTITVTYTGGSNVELQDREGNNSWIAHVYDFSDTVSVTPLSETNAFTNSSYLGAFTQANNIVGSTTSFSQNYGGGNTPSFAFVAGGTNQTFYAETFAVRYKMRSTLPQGCYFVQVRGDDGVKLSVDGVKVFDAWIQQGATDYTNILVYLNGNSQLVLDYYDKDEANVTDFSIYPAESTMNSVNIINTSGPVYRCAGSNSVLDGSAITYQGSNINPSIKFQWQSSPDNLNWTDISSANGENYTVPSTSPTATSIVYYRRNITGTAANASSCIYSTESIAVITSQNVNPTIPVLSTATNIFCSQFTANWTVVGSASGYYLDVSTNNSFTAMVPGYNNLDVGLVTSYNVTGLSNNTLYYYRLRAYNKCRNSTSASSGVVSTSTVSPVATISGNATICQNASSPNITLTNPQPLPVTITYNINGGSNATVNLAASSTVNIAVPTTSSGVFAYNLVNVAYQSSPTCSNLLLGSATVTVNPVHTLTAGGNRSVCQNSAMTDITMTLGGGATGANVTGLPAGVTSSVSGNTLTISGTPTVSGVFPYNITTTGNSCTAATTSGTITVGIGNNVINFTNGTSGTVCVTTPENGTSSFTAPTGTYFNTVSFSSYGSPTGSCGNFAINYTCHSATKSQSFVEGQLLGNTGTITFLANNANFDDPCVGTVKNYYGSAAYSSPVCSGTVPGTITGTTPTGSGTYTYLWQISTTSATAGFTAAPGTNNLQNYTPINSVTVNTWFRRVVTSGGTCPNTSAAVLIKVNPLPTIASAATASTICFGATSTSLVYTGTTGVPTTYSITWNSTPLNSFSPVTDASLTATPISIVIPSTATDGTYTGTITVKNANGCVSMGNTFSLVIRPQFTSGAINTTGETICSGGTPSQIGSTTAASGGDNMITYKWQANGVDIASSNSATYTPPIGLTATTVYRRFANDGTCNTTPTLSTGTWTVTVNSLPTTPTLTKNSDFTCTSSGSVTLTNLPSGTWTIKQTGTASQTITDTGSSRNITGLVAGNYDFTVTNAASCTSSPVVSVNIVNQTSTTTWNGSGWSNGNPDGTKTIIIASTASQPFTISTPNVSGCSLIVNSGAVVTIPSGVTLTITNSVTTNGQLIFENNSSLVQTTNAVNTGDIVYKRATSVRRYDLTYWSTPVTKPGFTLYNLSPDTLGDKFSYYDSNAAAWMINYNGTMVMEIGKSYNVRAPQYFDINTPSIFTAVFTGVPNNGDISVNTVSGKWNLIGNPFPSAIDADQLMAENPNLGSLYFWGHNALPTQSVPGDNKFYYSTDFTAYNATGTAGGDGLPFDGYIAAAQGFFAKPAAGTIIFNNHIRRPGNNTQFYKTSESTVEKNRLWLNMTHADGILKQALVGYVQGATNTIDVNYDAVTMGANAYIDFYSISESKKLTIQGRALPFDTGDLVPLGYKALIEGDFTIAIDHADGFFDTQAVYLEDKTTGKITDLRKENYTFKTAIGTFTDRFVLRYTSKTLGTDDFENISDGILVSVKNKIVRITSSKETINDVIIYNVLGQEIFNKKKINSTEFQISNLQTGNQVLLLKINLQNGHSTSKKIIMD